MENKKNNKVNASLKRKLVANQPAARFEQTADNTLKCARDGSKENLIVDLLFQV
jgi:hypothetical protein